MPNPKSDLSFCLIQANHNIGIKGTKLEAIVSQDIQARFTLVTV